MDDVRRSALRVMAAALLVGGAILSGCGGGTPGQAPAEAPPPAAPAHEPVSELDALEHDLMVSEQRLDAQLDKRLVERRHEPRFRHAEPPPAQTEKNDLDRAAAEDGEVSGEGDAKPSTDTVPTPETKPAAKRPDKLGDAVAPHALAGAPCDMACRALASMQRAAEGICELAGGDHPRCRRAEQRVDAAERRVTEAGCACRDQ